MSTAYKPTLPLGLFTPQQQQWITRELAAIHRALEGAKDHETYTYLHAEPVKIVPGMLVLADGTDWNPGSGVGEYRRDEANTEWVFVGESPSVEAASDSSTETTLEMILSVQTQQLVQLTKIALILSTVTGISLADEDVPLQCGSLQQLTNIASLLALMSESAVGATIN